LSRDLYTFFRSSTSYRLRIALAYKRLDYTPHYVSLPKMEHRTPSYRALHAQGLVPLLIDGDRSLIQSMAIIEYLDEVYPEPPLIPKDVQGRAYVRAVSQIIGCDIHPLNNVRVLKHIQAQFGADEAATNAWYRHWIAEGLGGLEAYVEGTRLSGQYCYGDTVTMADICLVPQIFNAQRFGCPLGDYPALNAIFERCMALDAFRATQPSTQARRILIEDGRHYLSPVVCPPVSTRLEDRPPEMVVAVDQADQRNKEGVALRRQQRFEQALLGAAHRPIHLLRQSCSGGRQARQHHAAVVSAAPALHEAASGQTAEHVRDVGAVDPELARQ